MDFFARCPNEVLEMIFSHLENEILELTLVSPRANKIISNSAKLIRSCRFKIDDRQQKFKWTARDKDSIARESIATRRYTQIDYFRVHNKSIFRDAPAFLTQVTLDECIIEADVFQAMLSKISKTLELLILKSCMFYEADFNGEVEKWKIPRSPAVELSKLKTLILADMIGKSRFFVISIIKTTNLTELGLNAKKYKLEDCAVASLVDLIVNNPQIRALAIPGRATEFYLHFLLDHPEIKIRNRFQELSLSIDESRPDIVDLITYFIDVQKDSLRGLRLEYCILEEAHVERLLLLNLARLEFSCCRLELPTENEIENFSIESLAFIGLTLPAPSCFGDLCRLIEKCKNLLALTVFIEPQPDEVSLQTLNRWKRIDTRKFLVKGIPRSELRHIRFCGVPNVIKLVKLFPKYLFFHQSSNELPVERHPFSIMKFEERSLVKRFSKFFNKKFGMSLLQASVVYLVLSVVLIFGKYIYDQYLSRASENVPYSSPTTMKPARTRLASLEKYRLKFD